MAIAEFAVSQFSSEVGWNLLGKVFLILLFSHPHMLQHIFNNL
jgi:hypothetical protein